MKYFKEFIELLNNTTWRNNKHFVGYGNPNSSILIIGKECAIDFKSEQYQEEYSRNFEMWCIEPEPEIKNWVENPVLDWSIFHPRAPYYGQRFAIEKRNKDNHEIIISGKGGTSSTWYNYQKLINYIRKQGKLSTPLNTTTIDFYNDCFITELNESCRVNNKDLNANEKQATESNIRNRFDLMIATRPFWSHFKTVILACGPYADALLTNKELAYSIFGNANIISDVDGRKIPQLSYAISDDLLKEIADQV